MSGGVNMWRTPRPCASGDKARVNMRILNISQTYHPYLAEGGRPTKVLTISRKLSERGHRVTVLTADLGPKGAVPFPASIEHTRSGRRAEHEGVETIYLRTRLRFRALTWNPSVMDFARDHLHSFDLVHIYGFYDLLGPVVAFFCRRHGIPYVIEPLGMYRPIARSLRLKRMFHRFVGSNLVRGARFLIATSEQERKELVDGGVKDSCVVVRRNGIEVPENLPERGTFRRQWGIPIDMKMVLFFGRLVSKKSPDLLLNAFAQWHRGRSCPEDVILVFAGPDEGDGFVSKLRALAEQFNMKERILFVGPLYDDAKWSAYRDADLFVLPSQNENFGNTAAEAAVCGTPMIVTDRCGIAPLIGDAGLVIQHDLRELQLALGKLLEDPVLRHRCRDGCEDLVRNLTWDDPLDELERLYRRCVSGENAR
jgi:glycosyltransferase involved in cell wall biosynthesis